MPCCSYRKDILLIIIFFVSCMYTNPEKKTYLIKSDEKGEKDIINLNFPSQIFYLSKTPDYALEERFRESVDNAWERAYEKYSINFNYSILPDGAVYPYSQVKVVCMSDAKTFSSNKFIENCNYFFSVIKDNLLKIKGDKR
ncbi:MAG: hypothetical protein ACP5IO_06970 [Elusimicrobiales bacterium]